MLVITMYNSQSTNFDLRVQSSSDLVMSKFSQCQIDRGSPGQPGTALLWRVTLPNLYNEL